MKKTLLFAALFFIALLSSIKAQTNGRNNKPAVHSQTVQTQAESKVQSKYRTVSSGAVVPLGTFANKDYSEAISGASGAKTGSLAEYSNLRVFGTRKVNPYYFGLYTQLTAYFNPIRYTLPSDNYYSDENVDKLHTFPAAELKLGPAMVFPIKKWLLFDVNANIGTTMAVPLFLGYSYYQEKTSGGIRTVTGNHLFGDQAVTVSMVGGIGGNMRIGNIVVGLDLNFGKLKFPVNKWTNLSTYETGYNTLIGMEDISSETYKDEMRITSLRIKIGAEW